MFDYNANHPIPPDEYQNVKLKITQVRSSSNIKNILIIWGQGDQTNQTVTTISNIWGTVFRIICNVISCSIRMLMAVLG